MLRLKTKAPIFMKKIALLLLCTFSCIVYPQALDKLKNCIMKSDIDGVRLILDTTILTEKSKTGLIDLANDIILMRLKTMEIYSFKQRIEQNDLNALNESFSAQTIEEIGFTETQFYIWASSFLVLLVSSIGVGFNLVLFIEEHIKQNSLPRLLGISGALFIGSLCSLAKTKEAKESIVSIIRNNLQKNYTNAILIKQLIINAPGSV